jgi:hypothetical protein
MWAIGSSLPLLCVSVPLRLFSVLTGAEMKTAPAGAVFASPVLVVSR